MQLLLTLFTTANVPLNPLPKFSKILRV